MKGIIVGAVVAVLLVVGIYFSFDTAVKADPQALESALVERVKHFWNLRIKNDWAGVYQEIMEPRIKDHVSLSDFVGARGMIQYLSYKIERVKVEGTTATVLCSVEVKINHPITRKMKNPYMQNTVEDTWVLIGGTWYRKYEERGVAG